MLSGATLLDRCRFQSVYLGTFAWHFFFSFSLVDIIKHYILKKIHINSSLYYHFCFYCVLVLFLLFMVVDSTAIT